MGRDGPELRGQHWDPVQHVLLWAHSCVPHTGNSHIPLEGIVLLGLGAGLELGKRFIGLLLEVHLGEDLLHVTGIAEPFLGAFSAHYGLELPVGDIEEPCKWFLHYRVGKGAVQLDISPLIPIRAKYVSTKEASINGPEGFLLIGICGFEFPGTGEFIYIFIGEGKNGDALVVPFDLHP